jgi:hypothetical protein
VEVRQIRPALQRLGDGWITLLGDGATLPAATAGDATLGVGVARRRRDLISGGASGSDLAIKTTCSTSRHCFDRGGVPG